MTLLDHLKRSGIKIPDFAATLGRSENTIRKIAYRQRQPSLPLAREIEQATGGAVTAADMILPPQVPLHLPSSLTACSLSTVQRAGGGA